MSKKIENGGSAFPMVGIEKDASGSVSDMLVIRTGMSLRDWFAGMALQSLIENGVLVDGKESVDPNDYADVAYKYADAMLRAAKGER